MTLSFHEKANMFLFVCEFSEWKYPRGAGFNYNFDLKLWTTQSVLNARKLKAFADSKALEAIEKKTQRLSETLRGSFSVDVPEGFVVPKPDNGMDFFPFQKAGIYFASQRTHTLLYDEMGVGKTIQAIGLMNLIGAKRVLIICPNSLKINWKRELDRWLVDKSLSYSISSASKIIDSDIMICNYEIFSRELTKDVGGRYNSTNAFFTITKNVKGYDLVVLDEAHKIKNWSANTTRNIFKIKKKATKTLIMTGTGILNRPDETWTHLRWCDIHKKFAKDKNEFIKTYCGGTFDPRFKTFKADLSKIKPETLQEFQIKLRSLNMIRRTKAQVFPEMPSKIRTIIPVPVDRELFKDYEKLEQEVYQIDFEKTMNLLSSISPRFIAELTELRKITGLSKVDATVDYVTDILENDEKVVLFCHHREVIAQYQRKLKSYNPVSVYGGVSIEDRDKAVNSFQNDPKCRLFIGQMDSAGVGLTLTASSNVVFAELHWVPAIANQCEDRIHRYGATQTSNIHLLVADQTLDAYVANLIVSKQKIIDRALNHEHIDPELLAQINVDVATP